MLLPDCKHRVATESDGTYFCRHRKVHAAHQLVSATFCRSCRNAGKHCENPRPIPEGPLAIASNQKGTLQYLSMERMLADSRALAMRVPDNLVGVAGIPRSGMLPASIIATLLHLPLYEASHKRGLVRLTSGLRMAKRTKKLSKQDGPILVVDDSVYSGHALKRVKEKLSKSINQEFVFAALYPRPNSISHVDLFARLAPEPHLFEWNLFNCNQTTQFAFDFDGILCEDFAGTDEEDGRYERFLETTRPKWLPRRKSIPLVVTARLERYRPQTTAWLKRYGVRVKRLVMGPWSSVHERREAFDAGTFKGGWYSKSDCKLFIESDERQAESIYLATRRPVLCPTVGKVFQ